jgi:hypothetical protein
MSETSALTKPDRRPQQELHDAYVAAMWVLFLRCPARNTGPGEPVDLGEVGEVREKSWDRLTPYSLATSR